MEPSTGPIDHFQPLAFLNGEIHEQWLMYQFSKRLQTSDRERGRETQQNVFLVGQTTEAMPKSFNYGASQATTKTKKTLK